MATGSAPFRYDDTLKLIYSHIHDNPISPRSLNPGIDPSLEQIILKLLRKDPKDRFQSASDLLRALEKIPKQKRILRG